MSTRKRETEKTFASQYMFTGATEFSINAAGCKSQKNQRHVPILPSTLLSSSAKEEHRELKHVENTRVCVQRHSHTNTLAP